MSFSISAIPNQQHEHTLMPCITKVSKLDKPIAQFLEDGHEIPFELIYHS